MSARAAVDAAAQALAGISDTPRLDAELLLAHALGTDRSRLLIDPAAHDVPGGFATLVDRRRAGEPVAYILGHAPFRTITLGVGPGVLIPRADSETLIDVAVAHFGSAGPATILDLGTGPGTLLLAALDQWPQARGHGIDISEAALGYARVNAERLGMAARASFAPGGWADGGAADLILANPPYIGTSEAIDAAVADHEPAIALFAGADGLDAYRVLMPALAPRIRPGGIAIVEIGYRQAAAVMALATAAGLAPTCHRDLGGRDRAIALTPLRLTGGTHDFA